MSGIGIAVAFGLTHRRMPSMIDAGFRTVDHNGVFGFPKSGYDSPPLASKAGGEEDGS